METQQTYLSNCNEEIWVGIPAYDGLYEASSYGRIRSVDGKVTSSARSPHRVWKQRIMKQKERVGKNRVDYMVTLWKDGVPHYHLVSRLVASAFHGDMLYTKMTVNHIDGNPLNNCSDNLEWLSLSDNIKLGFESGLYNSIKKPVIASSECGDTIQASSMAEMDRKLNRYRGYTSHRLQEGFDTLVDSLDNIYNVYLV